MAAFGAVHQMMPHVGSHPWLLFSIESCGHTKPLTCQAHLLEWKLYYVMSHKAIHRVAMTLSFPNASVSVVTSRQAFH